MSGLAFGLSVRFRSITTQTPASTDLAMRR